tara:strand:- start:458 stop:619 length:162 start_codon:yes stop_codon:yes gene_type:complete
MTKNISSVFINFYKLFLPKETISLGRWKTKSQKEVDYFMNNLIPDPGYPLKFK